MIVPDNDPVNQNAAPEPAPSESAASPTSADSSTDRPETVRESDSAGRRLPAAPSPLPGDSQSAGDSLAAGQSESAVQSQSTENLLGEEELPPSGTLAEAISHLGLDISADKVAKLDEYCQRLWELNEHINLTRHTTYDLFVRRDLLDTYELAKFLGENEEVLDVGTGGGVPGIPLAILRPDLKVSLCDSVGKKARAADTLVSQLKLPVYVYSARVQDVLDDHSFDTLVTRAAGSITQLCNWLNDYWHCFNRLLAIKGPRWVEERKEARHRGTLHGTVLRRIHGYRMPGTKSESVILQLHRPRPGSAS